MTTLARKLEARLAAAGWQVASRDRDLEWRADEQWRVVSLWAAVDFMVYVT